jgi:hypothetical protein
MRKLTLGIGAICLCFALVLPATADPGTTARADVFQFAFADWINMHGSTGDFYAAMAFRSSDRFWSEQPGPETFGFFFKGKCRRHKAEAKGTKGSPGKGGEDDERGKDVSIIICSGSGFGKDIEPWNFFMDPLTLSTARLHAETSRHVHDVTWTGRGDGPEKDNWVSARGTRANAGSWMVRMAGVEGELFGERMRPAWSDLGFLYQDVSAFARLSARGVDIDFNRDGRVKVTRRFRVVD